jgi:hypothetical protein
MNNDELDRNHWKTIGNLLVYAAYSFISALVLLMFFSGAFLWSLIL